MPRRSALALVCIVAIGGCSAAATPSPSPAPTVEPATTIAATAEPTPSPSASPSAAKLQPGPLAAGLYTTSIVGPGFMFTLGDGWVGEAAATGDTSKIVRDLSDGTKATLEFLALPDAVFKDVCSPTATVQGDGTEFGLLSLLRDAFVKAGLEPNSFTIDFPTNNRSGMSLIVAAITPDVPKCQGGPRSFWSLPSGQPYQVPNGEWADVDFFQIGQRWFAAAIRSTTPPSTDTADHPIWSALQDLTGQIIDSMVAP